jgi:protein transport protein SEC24
MPNENGIIQLPPRLNLSSEKLDRSSVFLLDNGLELLLWIGRMTPPEILDSLFGQPSLDLIACGKVSLPILDKEWNKRLRNLISTIRDIRLRQATVFPSLYIIREDGDPQLRMWFLSHLIEDRIDNQLSYPQFLGTVREKVQQFK